MMTSGPFHEWFFHLSSNFMEISICPHLGCNKLIAMLFCAWHDSWAVVVCEQFYSDMVPYTRVILKPTFHRIWITMEKLFMKWALGIGQGPSSQGLASLTQFSAILELSQRVFAPWWRHQIETFSALLAICAGNSLVPGEFPTQRPVTQKFDIYFDLCSN